MGMSERIAVAVDFSDASKAAVRATFELAQMCGAKLLTMIHALRPVVMPVHAPPAYEQQLINLRKRLRDAAESELDAMLDELSAPADLIVEHRIVEGHPADAIP